VPKVVDHDERRQEILAQCFDLFAVHGYGAMTMRKLAAAMGVSTGTLYHYFDGKPALFEAMFRWLRDRDIRAATEGIPEDASQAERLARLGVFLQNHESELRKAVRVALDYQRQQSDADSRRFLVETLGEYRRALRDQLGLEEHPQLTTVLLSFILGMSVQGILDPDAVHVEHHLTVLALAAQAVAGVEPV